jgi:uncharacterized membrane protein
MSAKTWMKWLSVIALVMSGLQVSEGFSNMFFGKLTETVTFLRGPNFTDVAVFLIAIVAVIISFSKK